MEFTEVMEKRNEMCKYYMSLSISGICSKECPLHSSNNGSSEGCFSLIRSNPAKFEDIVKGWVGIDWSSIPVDTRVLVRDDRSEDWVPRHYAGFVDSGNRPHFWINGCTSWTAYDSSSTATYKYYKLPEDWED